MTILVLSLKKENKALITKVNLGQTRLIHVSQTYISQLYQNGQVNQDMKELLVWSKKGSYVKELSKLEMKFTERRKKINYN